MIYISLLYFLSVLIVINVFYVTIFILSIKLHQFLKENLYASLVTLYSINSSLIYYFCFKIYPICCEIIIYCFLILYNYSLVL